MRHSWLILIATGTLAFGAIAATAGPSAASPVFGHPQTKNFTPGGLARGMTGTPRSGRFAQVVQSANWAGYVASGSNGEATSVTSNWVQPAAHCTSGDQYGAFWVGLDGYTSSTVEQTGSEADCIGRSAEYAAWYEFYPAYPVYFNEPVRAGDQFTGTVSYTSSQFTVTLTDHTQSWTQSHTQAVSGAARSSAEVIAEAPCCTNSGNPLPLTNFGTVSFSSALVNGAGLCTTSPVELEMVSKTYNVTLPLATPSSISNCENFSITSEGGHGIWGF
jgi:Peptidase A4 family